MMEGHHESLEMMIAEVSVAARTMRSRAIAASITALADVLERMCPLLNEHMSVEEERVLPLLDTYITAAEWSRMAQDGAAQTSPADFPLIFGMVMYEGDPDVIRHMLSNVSSEARPGVMETASRAGSMPCPTQVRSRRLAAYRKICSAACSTAGSTSRLNFSSTAAAARRINSPAAIPCIMPYCYQESTV